MRISTLMYGSALILCFVPVLAAQDAAKVDPTHYKVVSENDEVRILRVHYGPHEKSAVMHSHPASVVVPLTGGKTKFNLPGGKSETVAMKRGEAQYEAKTVHQPENVGDQPMDAIVIELKK